MRGYCDRVTSDHSCFNLNTFVKTYILGNVRMLETPDPRFNKEQGSWQRRYISPLSSLPGREFFTIIASWTFERRRERVSPRRYTNRTSFYDTVAPYTGVYTHTGVYVEEKENRETN